MRSVSPSWIIGELQASHALACAQLRTHDGQLLRSVGFTKVTERNPQMAAGDKLNFTYRILVHAGDAKASESVVTTPTSLMLLR